MPFDLNHLSDEQKREVLDRISHLSFDEPEPHSRVCQDVVTWSNDKMEAEKLSPPMITDWLQQLRQVTGSTGSTDAKLVISVCSIGAASVHSSIAETIMPPFCKHSDPGLADYALGSLGQHGLLSPEQMARWSSLELPLRTTFAERNAQLMREHASSGLTVKPLSNPLVCPIKLLKQTKMGAVLLCTRCGVYDELVFRWQGKELVLFIDGETIVRPTAKLLRSRGYALFHAGFAFCPSPEASRSASLRNRAEKKDRRRQVRSEEERRSMDAQARARIEQALREEAYEEDNSLVARLVAERKDRAKAHADRAAPTARFPRAAFLRPEAVRRPAGSSVRWHVEVDEREKAKEQARKRASIDAAHQHRIDLAEAEERRVAFEKEKKETLVRANHVFGS